MQVAAYVDTSPLSYLFSIGEIHLLPQLFGKSSLRMKYIWNYVIPLPQE